MKSPKVLAATPLKRLQRAVKLGLWIALPLCVSVLADSHKPALITSLKVDVAQSKVEVRVGADRNLSMQALLLNHPDRIVLDAAGALFKVGKTEIQINSGQVKSVHIGLIQSRPPITRIVVEMSSPLAYTFHSEKNSALLEIPLQTAPAASEAAARKPATLNVTYDRGLLTIAAENCSLAEILNAVHSKTGGMTEFPASAANERATVKLGPAPLVSVVAALLQGSPFDYLIVGSGQQSGGFQILLSEKGARPDNQERPAQAVAVATPEPTTIVGEARASSVSPSGEGGGMQPDGGAQFMTSGQASGISAGETTSPDVALAAIDDRSENAPVQRTPPREGPRVLPAGKGH